MKQFPCIKQYVLVGEFLETIIKMTNSLTDKIFS